MRLIHVLCIVGALGVYLLYPNYEYAHATHLERGCKAPPAYMEVPHWVANYLCDYPQLGGISVWITQEDGSRVDIVSFYTSQEAADRGDMSEYVATAVFELDLFGNRRRLLIFGTADGSKQYVAGEVVEGLAL